MFGGNRKGDGASRFGALKSGSTALAPRLEFSARGHESRVDLRRFCAPVENQQTLPSCNACAVVSALEFQNLKAGRQHVDLSVLYVYWFARKLAGNEKNKVGLLCHHATAAVMAYGVCEDKDWVLGYPGTPFQQCSHNGVCFNLPRCPFSLTVGQLP